MPSITEPLESGGIWSQEKTEVMIVFVLFLAGEGYMGQFLQGGKNGSSLAHLEPKLELFEVLEFGS